MFVKQLNKWHIWTQGSLLAAYELFVGTTAFEYSLFIIFCPYSWSLKSYGIGIPDWMFPNLYRYFQEGHGNSSCANSGEHFYNTLSTNVPVYKNTCINDHVKQIRGTKDHQNKLTGFIQTFRTSFLQYSPRPSVYTKYYTYSNFFLLLPVTPI